MKEKQVLKAEPSKVIKADPRFDLSLISAKEQRVKAGSHKLPVQQTENDEEAEKEKRLKTKKTKRVKQAEQPAAHTAHSSTTSSSSSSHTTSSKKSSSAGIALSSALRAELAGGSSKKRNTTYSTHASDDENDDISLALDAVLPGTKVKKVKGPAPVSEEILEAARRLSKSQRRKLESIEKRKELELKVCTPASSVQQGQGGSMRR